MYDKGYYPISDIACRKVAFGLWSYRPVPLATLLSGCG
jgi:hypothetical protein